MRSINKYWQGQLADKELDALAREAIAFNDGKKDILARFGRPADYTP